MKKIIITLALAVVAVASASALTPKQMNGRACEGLVGPVKTVKYDGGSTTTFNSAGQIVSVKYDSDTYTYKYQTATSYTTGQGEKYRITYTATTRSDLQPYGEKFGYVYTFDSKGRIVKERSDIDFFVTETQYFYKGDSKVPYRVTYHSGEGGYVYESDFYYEYLQFDSHGNWTKRSYKGIRRESEADVDPVVGNINGTSTRTITYY